MRGRDGLILSALLFSEEWPMGDRVKFVVWTVISAVGVVVVAI